MTLSHDRVTTTLAQRAGLALVMMLAVVAGTGGLSMAAGDSVMGYWSVESNQAFSQFGYSVASAGDVNGDGYDDVIVGNPLYNDGKADVGRALVYWGSPSGLAFKPDWTGVNVDGGRFGSSVASAGDVNGDGFDDVIVGNPLYNDGKVTGRADLYLGSETGLANEPAWTAYGDDYGSQFGFSVASAGDVNNDSFDDVIVGNPLYNDGKFDVGKAYLFLGSEKVFLEAKPVWTETGQPYSNFGFSVASAGDVDNDGFDDIIVGNPLYNSEGSKATRAPHLYGIETDEGQASVYLGSSKGPATEPDWTAEGDQAGSQFGFSVASAGDVDGDTYGDVIVGNPLYNNVPFAGNTPQGSMETDEGRAYVYLGSETGLDAIADWIAESNQAGSQLGLSVAGVGDVNNDGYGDVIVGNPLYNTTENDAGRALIYFGSGTGLAAIADWIIEGDQADSQFGFSVARAGHINNDGFDDIIAGNPLYNNGETDEGRAYVYHGSTAVPVELSRFTIE